MGPPDDEDEEMPPDMEEMDRLGDALLREAFKGVRPECPACRRLLLETPHFCQCGWKNASALN